MKMPVDPFMNAFGTHFAGDAAVLVVMSAPTADIELGFEGAILDDATIDYGTDSLTLADEDVIVLTNRYLGSVATYKVRATRQIRDGMVSRAGLLRV